MKWLLLFLIKLFYTFYYIFRIIFQFTWKFNIKDVDWTANTCNPEFGEWSGHYCKNIFTMWLEKYEYDKELEIQWKNNPDNI